MTERVAENRKKMDLAVATIRAKRAQTQETLDAMLAERLRNHGEKSHTMSADEASKMLDDCE